MDKESANREYTILMSTAWFGYYNVADWRVQVVIVGPPFHPAIEQCPDLIGRCMKLWETAMSVRYVRCGGRDMGVVWNELYDKYVSPVPSMSISEISEISENVYQLEQEYNRKIQNFGK